MYFEKVHIYIGIDLNNCTNKHLSIQEKNCINEQPYNQVILIAGLLISHPCFLIIPELLCEPFHHQVYLKVDLSL